MLVLGLRITVLPRRRRRTFWGVNSQIWTVNALVIRKVCTSANRRLAGRHWSAETAAAAYMSTTIAFFTARHSLIVDQTQEEPALAAGHRTQQEGA